MLSHFNNPIFPSFPSKMAEQIFLYCLKMSETYLKHIQSYIYVYIFILCKKTLISNFWTKIIVRQKIVVLLRVYNKEIRYCVLKKVARMSLFRHSEVRIFPQWFFIHFWGLQIRVYWIWIIVFFYNSAVLVSKNDRMKIVLSWDNVFYRHPEVEFIRITAKVGVPTLNFHYIFIHF